MEENATIWNEEKLNKLIQDKIEENYSLEYKAAGALTRTDKSKSEITKDISAMANSGGGTLIYGLSEFADESLKHLPEKIDPINRMDFSKEWLENITSQIRPRIPNIKIHSIQLASNSNHVAYAVEIPQGDTVHQANDFRYYRRYNFQAMPMPDNEVRDVMNRKTQPKISVNAKFAVYPVQNKDGTTGALVIEIENTSDVFVRYTAITILSPLKVKGLPLFYEDDHTLEESADFGHALRLSFSNHTRAPLFPHSKLKKIFKFQIGQTILRASGREPEKQLEYFQWVAFADSMPKQTGIFAVDDIYTKM